MRTPACEPDHRPKCYTWRIVDTGVKHCLQLVALILALTLLSGLVPLYAQCFSPATPACPECPMHARHSNSGSVVGADSVPPCCQIKKSVPGQGAVPALAPTTVNTGTIAPLSVSGAVPAVPAVRSYVVAPETFADEAPPQALLCTFLI
jgi:hypothetical protein